MYKLDPRCIYDNKNIVTCSDSSETMGFGPGKHFDKPRGTRWLWEFRGLLQQTKQSSGTKRTNRTWLQQGSDPRAQPKRHQNLTQE